jgi:DNA processing protein
VLEAGPAGWREAGLGIGGKTIRFLQSPPWEHVDAALCWQEQAGNHILIQSDPAYPRLLRDIDDAPPVLYVCGKLETLMRPQLALVGSRNPSPDGRENAFQFARSLAMSGLCVTSGLAMGVDTEAHRGALAAKGVTVAVAGTGLDRVYPASNRDLAHQIAASGALVSEFPLGSGVRPSNFPRRNRIISGLSLGTVVVEATTRSGSLITARLAMEQGREVFAIPGSIHNPLARGCHRLLRDGAKLVETADDILEELGPLAGLALEYGAASQDEIGREAGHEAGNVAAIAGRESPGRGPGIDPEYRVLLAAIGFDPVPVDVLIARSGLTAETVSSMLIILELNGDSPAGPGGL